MSTALTGAPATVPHQPTQFADTDPLLHQDPVVAAEQAALEALLRCWCRERGAAPDADGVLRIELLGGAARLVAPVRHWSPCGWHRFERVELATGPEQRGAALDAVTAAALLARSAAARPEQVADLVGRVADSVHRTGALLRHRRSRPHTEVAGEFLRAEQALLLGHPLHPTPKSRDGLGPAQSAAYSPELRGSFALHWFAVERELLAADSALPADAARLTAELLDAPGLLPPNTAALPLHPGRPRSWRAGRRSPRCSTRACCTTSAGTARPGIRPARCGRCSAPAHRGCSSSRWACGSPTPAGRTCARNCTGARRCTGCWRPVSAPSGRPRTRASTSCATPPGSASTCPDGTRSGPPGWTPCCGCSRSPRRPGALRGRAGRRAAAG